MNDLLITLRTVDEIGRKIRDATADPTSLKFLQNAREVKQEDNLVQAGHSHSVTSGIRWRRRSGTQTLVSAWKEKRSKVIKPANEKPSLVQEKSTSWNT